MSGRFFRVGAIVMVGAAVYHATAVLVPAFGRAAYPATYPLWRHFAFIVIDTGFGWLFLRRSEALVWLYGLLTVQVYSGHGRYALMRWTNDGEVAWVDILSVLGASVLLILLVVDRYQRRPVTVR
jgi:hypothetical protein